MFDVWVMSKSFRDHFGHLTPRAWSYGYNYSCMGFCENEWGLVWLSLDTPQFEFLCADIDPNVQMVGTDHDPPTPLLLETYKNWLDPKQTYFTVAQVVSKLGRWQGAFLDALQRDPTKP